MEFQRARTKEQIQNREDEILSACYTLLQQEEYELITLKAISEIISISRTSLYSYYQTKEEVFLDLLKREYLAWGEELRDAFDQKQAMEKEEFCHLLTDTLLRRDILMELLSVHLTAIEKNCSLEKLILFKKESQKVFDILMNGIAKFFPQVDLKKRVLFLQQFLIFTYGLYPYSHPTEKQQTALKQAGIRSDTPETNQFCYKGLLLLAAEL